MAKGGEKPKKDCGGGTDAATRSIELPVLQNAPRIGVPRASKIGKKRAFALILLNVLMIAHFVQWRMSGSTVSPIEPSESMQTLKQGAVNAGFIFFVLAILATLIFGRFVCGWGCHILALQDLCGWILKKLGLKPRPFRSRLLVFVPLLAGIYMFIVPTVLRAISRPKGTPIFPGFTNHLITTEFWATFPPWYVAIPFLFVCGFLTVYFLGQKGFCTYACPYGGFFALADKVAPGRIRVTDDCEQCGHCTAVCTSNVLVHLEVKEHGMVVDPGCMKCMDCVSVCPNDALYFGFGKLPVAAIAKPATKTYSLNWPEEIAAALVFFVSLLAVWDVYQLVPMLMALGWAAVTTFIVMRCVRLFRSSDLTFYKFVLKTGGKFKIAGLMFVLFSLLWVTVTAHSGWIRYNERAGARAFESLQIPDELALARSDSDQFLSPSDKLNIDDGLKSLGSARRYGLFSNVEALPKLAWFEFLSGDGGDAVELLKIAASNQSGQGRALSLYYRGAILNRLGRYDEALTDLDQATAERPDLATAREEAGASLWKLGRRDDAVAAWQAAIKANPRLPLANNYLAGAGVADAARYEKQADQLTPNDPYFHWMMRARLTNLGMNGLAEKYLKLATKVDPKLATQTR